MFDQLQGKMMSSFKKLRGQHKISEANIEDALKEVRLSLLEADVNFKVVRGLLERVKQQALGADVLTGVSPGQQFVQIFRDELVTTLGGGAVDLNCRERPSV